MIRVLIADDHSIVRQGLRQILSETSDMTVAGEANSAHETMESAHHQRCDVLVLDISLPGRSGFDVLRDLHAQQPRLPVLMLSIYSEEQFALRALKAGAAGYLTKDSTATELVAAIRKVASGGKYISPALAERLAFRLESADRLPHELLSQREFQVMHMIASGRSAQEMATELQLSIKTVSTYRARIMEKLSLTSTAAIMRYAVHHRLVEA